MSDTATVVHEYHAAYNAVIEPDKYVACSRYLIRRWMPLLGENGTRLVLALRSLGYYNPKTGEKRDGIEIELPELAAMVGVSVATLKREFGDRKGRPGVPQNPALRRFVTKEQQYWRDPVTNRLLRTANIYRVKMDDPLHDDDLPRLNEILGEMDKAARASKAQSEPQMPSAKRRPPASKAQCESESSQGESKTSQTDSNSSQVVPPGAQNEPTLRDYSDLPENIIHSLMTPPAQKSLSFETGEGRRGWGDLTDAERGPWCRRSESEQRSLLGPALRLDQAIRARLVEARARTLFEQAQRATDAEGEAGPGAR